MRVLIAGGDDGKRNCLHRNLDNYYCCCYKAAVIEDHKREVKNELY